MNFPGFWSRDEDYVVSVEYHADLKEVQCDAHLAAWLSPSAQTAPFDRLAWWQALAEHCALTPLLAVARDGDAMAALPLAGTGCELTALANWYTFRFRPLACPESEGAMLFAAIARDLARRARRVTIKGLPGEDGSADMLERAFRTTGWHCRMSPSDINHVLPVNGRSYEEFLSSRPGQLRTTLKRKTKKVETRVLVAFEPAVWADYEAIYAESWKPEEGSPDFLRAFAEAEGAAGRLRLGIALADGVAVAAQMWTVEGGTAFIHKLAHREAAKPLSPGSVLSAALFRHVIDLDRVRLVDFGTGDDPYKRDWMEAMRPRYTLEAMRLSAPQNWPSLAKSGLRRLAGRGGHG